MADAQFLQNFYDIESLDNVYSLCNFKYNENIIDVFVLVDDPLDTSANKFTLTDNIQNYIAERIYAKNKNFTGAVNFFDLTQYASNIYFINTFGAKDNDKTFEKLAETDHNFKLFVNDTDAEYSDKKYPYLMGYNSFNYDTTSLALYISDTFWLKNGELQFSPVTARQMRNYNNELFTPAYKSCMPSYLQRDKSNSNSGQTNRNNRENIIRQNMLRSGRHIDVAALNEKMQKVALKRILGMLGHQILESDKLDSNRSRIYTLDELADLIAYNVSDVVNLHEVFIHPVYQGNFELKKGLLETYPELVYNENPGTYKPDVRPDNVRPDRLYIDSSSAKLAAKTLCPYGVLHDRETVSFVYPCKEKAEALGIPQINVLDECRKFFYGLYPNRPDLQAEFDRIYFYYKNNIEGRNFNSSNEYAEYWSEQYKLRHEVQNDVLRTPLPAYSMSEIPKCNLTLPYYQANGEPSRYYVVFGVGGIHGAEYNKDAYVQDMEQYTALEQEFEEFKQYFDYIKQTFPDPAMLKQKDPATKKPWKLEYNGKKYKASDFLQKGATKDFAEWKEPDKSKIEKKKPQLFKQKASGVTSLNDAYTYTSNADSNHEDFTSYYPNLLIMMGAFYNQGLGYDRYAEIFENKQKYGKLMKDKNISEEEKYHYSILRSGTKLILNSASGAADASFFTPIRMNNQIMSMRIIGQLFTWRIGQAQAYEGAGIISTNTDGLFTVFEATKNAEILAREAANIHVEIEPEFCHLVSKDTNNRIEIDEKGNIIAASGGSLACYKRPDPTKSLAHAAIIDYAMCEYLRNVDNIHGNTPDFLAEPFDMDKGKVILYNARFAFPDSVRYLNMFQTIVASSIGSNTYIFGETKNFQGYKDQLMTTPFNQGLFDAACACKDINIMQHYNRVFFVRPEFQAVCNKPLYMLSNAAARVVTPAQKLTRQRNNLLPIWHDPYAKALLEKFGLPESEIPEGKEAKVTKVSGIDAEWYVYIENRSLFELTDEEKQALIDNLDMDCYLTLFASSFNKNWANGKFASSDDANDDEA